MLPTVLRTLTRTTAVLLLVTASTMLLLDLTPGDPAFAVLGEGATAEQLDAVREELDLDDPFASRYRAWLGDVATGDFGRSLRTNQPVSEAILERLPVTVELAILAQLLALVVAVPLAVYTAYRPEGLIDRSWGVVTSVFISVPHYVGGLVLSYVLSVRLDLFPVTGWVRISENLGENLRAAFLPVLTLALGEAAIYSRLLRADMLTTLQEDYIRAATAKGMRPRSVLLRHALRPSSLPLVTLAGLSLGRLLGGAVIVETIFALPGLGQLLVQAVKSQDLVMVQGTVAFVAIAYVLINLGADVLQTVLDPRVREGRT